MFEETGDILSPGTAVWPGPLAGAAGSVCWVPVDITVVAFPMEDEKADDESRAEEGTEETEEEPPPPNTEEEDVPPGDEDLDLQLEHDIT